MVKGEATACSTNQPPGGWGRVSGPHWRAPGCGTLCSAHEGLCGPPSAHCRLGWSARATPPRGPGTGRTSQIRSNGTGAGQSRLQVTLRSVSACGLVWLPCLRSGCLFSVLRPEGRESGSGTHGRPARPPARQARGCPGRRGMLPWELKAELKTVRRPGLPELREGLLRRVFAKLKTWGLENVFLLLRVSLGV